MSVRATARRAGLCVRKSVLRGVVGRFLQRQVALSVAGRRKHQVFSPTNVFEHDREKVGLRMVVEPSIFLFFLQEASFSYIVRKAKSEGQGQGQGGVIFSNRCVHSYFFCTMAHIFSIER